MGNVPQQQLQPPLVEESNRIGDIYQVTDQVIGRGTYATVMLGFFGEKQEKVAVRVIETAHQSATNVAFAREEADLHPRLQHPNIVRCFFAHETPQSITFILEYFPDGDLQQYCEAFTPVGLPEFQVQAIASQLASALHYLHTHGVVHRDVKPENILVRKYPSFIVKLADFGLAGRINPEQPYFTTHPGSLYWCSPEVVKGVVHLGPPRDVWGLGLVLYFTFTTICPFAGSTVERTIDRIIRYEPDMRRRGNSMSKEAQDAISRMLTKDPNMRLSLTQLLSHPWLETETFATRNNLAAPFAHMGTTKAPPRGIRCL